MPCKASRSPFKSGPFLTFSRLTDALGLSSESEIDLKSDLFWRKTNCPSLGEVAGVLMGGRPSNCWGLACGLSWGGLNVRSGGPPICFLSACSSVPNSIPRFDRDPENSSLLLPPPPIGFLFCAGAISPASSTPSDRLSFLRWGNFPRFHFFQVLRAIDWPNIIRFKWDVDFLSANPTPSLEFLFRAFVLRFVFK